MTNFRGHELVCVQDFVNVESIDIMILHNYFIQEIQIAQVWDEDDICNGS